MKNISNVACVLKLNKNFMPVGIGVVSKTICDLMTGVIKALDIVYGTNADGTVNFDLTEYVNPVTWDEWIQLPVLDHHLCIHSTKLSIRVPTVVVTTNYSKIHFKKFQGKPTKEALFIRDNGLDGYTGYELEYEFATLDHVHPLSRGGTDTYDNVVLTTKEINNKKGNRLNNEVGLKLLINPRHPRPLPVSHTIKKSRHKDWLPFLMNKK
jgi:5-methylcytosine-specific restriction endonuclease McrA